MPGKSLRQREFGFRIWSREPLLMTASHHHNDIEINVVERGAVTYLFAGRTVEVHEQQVLVFWAATPHRMTVCAPNTYVHWITLPLAWMLQNHGLANFGRDLLRARPAPDPMQADDPARLRRWEDDLARGGEHRAVALLELEARLRRLALERLIARELPAVRERSRPPESKAALIARFLAAHFTEPIGVDDAARHANVHPHYAMAIFKEAFGVGIAEYVTQHRVAHAQQLLATTDHSVLDIALQSGFGSASRFYEAFKQVCGVAPRTYRRELRTNA